ncbi:ArnT family glycosyltransferase [Candidatus Uabimicrobium amorphum]|uniref:Glycosyltransferase RgtA/B/C/D-like domain-containing protein n=1 Tax=Uabimicrobium amorphum TaxID=2596890 RepID=A0A5S9ILT0_UABAM|nr:glycosyltransferase family 39 protein [Candidatus Uabimicrobium amorphum]BBM83786.1 hypothetical protein UABAM_02141 [Candidatus Uabimicrobium amorphum]
MSRTTKILIAIFFFGIVLRTFVVFFSPDHFVFPDSTSYDQIAKNILSGKGFIENPNSQAVRPPVYPLFLALIYLFNSDLVTIKIVQAVIGSCSVFLVFFLAHLLLHNVRVALIAAFLFAIDPLQIAFCSLALSETLFCFLFLMILISLFKTCEHNSSKYAICLGVLCAIGSLLRSVLLPFTIFIGFFWLWRDRRQWHLIFVFWVSVLVTMSPWILRNAFIFHDFIPTTTKSGINLYEALGPGATGGPRMLKMKLPENYWQLGEIQRDKLLRKKTLQFIKDDPSRPLYLAMTKFLRLWNMGFNDYKLRNSNYINHVIVLFSVGLYLFFLCGVLWLDKSNYFYLLVPILYISLVHMVFLGSIRYRVPVLACLDIVAAIALAKLYRFYENRISGNKM